MYVPRINWLSKVIHGECRALVSALKVGRRWRRARVPETRSSRYRVRARYCERHTNNATEMSPYVRFDSLFSVFRCFALSSRFQPFPSLRRCSQRSNRKTPVNSGVSRTIDDFRVAEEPSNDRKTIRNLIDGADRPCTRCFFFLRPSPDEKSSL